MITIPVKAISVNKAWRGGRRFKTAEYRDFERECFLTLPNSLKVEKGRKRIDMVFGLSNKRSDLDNCIKAFWDALQVKYGFNDSDFYEMSVKKVMVKKGEEFISFEISNEK